MKTYILISITIFNIIMFCICLFAQIHILHNMHSLVCRNELLCVYVVLHLETVQK